MSVALFSRLTLAFAVLALAGCASYHTPGGPIDVREVSRADDDIAAALEREPAARFPARIAIARAQASGYSSRSQPDCFGRGRYCVITAREIESDTDFATLTRLPMIAGVAPLSRVLLPQDFSSFRDLRIAAAQLRADMLLVYTVDTRFHVGGSAAPLALLSLGTLPTNKARVTSTAAAVLIDVRTGFIYGLAEGTASDEQRSSPWSTETVVDRARLATETEAFHKLTDEFGKVWKGVVEEHARP
jgi:hypothetical protein